MKIEAATVPQDEAEMAKVQHYLGTVALHIGVPEMWLEDCVQEMLVAIWQAPPTMKGTVVACYKAIDFVRKFGVRGRCGTRRHASLEELEEAGVDSAICRDEIASRISCLDARQALQQVTPRRQKLLGLQACGYSAGEIAAYLGQSASAVLTQISLGRTQLKRMAC